MKVLTRMIRSLFGLSSDETETESEPQKSQITVEREPNTASEDAVKGTATDAGDSDVAESSEVSELETGSDADTADSETEMVDEEPDEEVAFEEEEGPVADEGDDEPVVESEDESADEPEAESEAEETAEPVDQISGIGPTYSDRLGSAGIGTVANLADSDPETVADAAQVSESRASDWIDRAQDFA
ncbi:MAG: helix-hairpin-helix domain-containing protein [Halovenus sp.]